MPAATPPMGGREQRAFFYLFIAQAVIVLALQTGALVFLQSKVDLMNPHPLRAIICHYIFLAVLHLSQVALTIEAIWTLNHIEVFWLVTSQLILIPISSTQIFETRDALLKGVCAPGYHCPEFDHLWHILRPMEITTTVVHGLIFPAQLIVGTIVCYRLGWDWAYTPHAVLQPHMWTYGAYLLTSKFTFFVNAFLSAQLFVLAYGDDWALVGLSIVGLVLTVAIFGVGHVAVRYELKWLLYATVALMGLMQTYLFWRFVAFFLPRTRHSYYNVRVSLSLQVVFQLVFQSLAMHITYMNRTSFGHAGLQAFKRGEPDPALRRAWRVGESLPNPGVRKPPGTDYPRHYYAEGEEMKERESMEMA